MRAIERPKRLTFRDGDGGRDLEVYWDNRGEPYRDGVSFYLHDHIYSETAGTFLEAHEAVQLRDLLNRLYPIAALKDTPNGQ